MLFPVKKEDLSKCTYSSKYGERWGTFHRGIDIGMPINTKLYSPLDGIVKYNKTNSGGPSTGYGHYLVLYHEKENLYTLYAHLNSRSYLKVGDKIKAGVFIAYSGNTGKSTGPHLHFEVHKNGFLYKSQIKNKDTTIDPVKCYPDLRKFLGKKLTDLKIDKGVDIVKFEHKWQSDQLISVIQSLGKKGLINNSDDWVKKFKEGKMTESELGLISLTILNKIK